MHTYRVFCCLINTLSPCGMPNKAGWSIVKSSGIFGIKSFRHDRTVPSNITVSGNLKKYRIWISRYAQKAAAIPAALWTAKRRLLVKRNKLAESCPRTIQNVIGHCFQTSHPEIKPYVSNFILVLQQPNYLFSSDMESRNADSGWPSRP